MENNKPVFYMLVGLPASGKSSESDRLGDVIVRSSEQEDQVVIRLLINQIISEISSVEI